MLQQLGFSYTDAMRVDAWLVRKGPPTAEAALALITKELGIRADMSADDVTAAVRHVTPRPDRGPDPPAGRTDVAIASPSG